MRLAVLKEIKGKPEVVLEYNDAQVIYRLQARVRENLSMSENMFKHSWSKDQVQEAIDKAWADLLVEFKEETVSLS